MKICILGWDPGEDDPEGPALLAFGRERGHEMSLHTLQDVRYHRGAGDVTVRLGTEDVAGFDAVISRANLFGHQWSDHIQSGEWRDRVERLSMVSQVLGSRMFDSAEVWLTGYSKFLTAQRLADGGFPIPPFRSATSIEEVAAALDEWGDIIAKPSYGLRGIDVERVTDLDEQRTLVDDLLTCHGTLVCQPFYPTQFGEYRIYVAGEVAPIKMLKLPPVGTWRCKVTEDASFERFDAPDELIDLAVRATRQMGITLAGLDILPTPDGYRILEVNPVAGGLSIFGTRVHQEVLGGVFDWVEKRIADLR